MKINVIEFNDDWISLQKYKHPNGLSTNRMKITYKKSRSKN